MSSERLPYIDSSEDVRRRASSFLAGTARGRGASSASRVELTCALFVGIGADNRGKFYRASTSSGVVFNYVNELERFFLVERVEPPELALGEDHQIRAASVVESMRLGGASVTWRQRGTPDAVGKVETWTVFADERGGDVAVHRFPLSGAAVKALMARFDFDEFATWVDGARPPPSPEQSLDRLGAALDELLTR